MTEFASGIKVMQSWHGRRNRIEWVAKSIDLFALGGYTFRLFDIIPQTHAVLVLNKVLSLGAGSGDVAFELIALVVLSALYFAAGVWLFQRMHLRAP